MESTLWMGDIEPWMTREIILGSFFEYGLKPSSIKMIKDHQFNSIKNYCFVNFDSITEANKAIISLNGKNIPKTNINFKLNWANKHCEMNRNLYVGNLPNDIDDLQLFNIFKEKYQSIHHVSIMTDNGQSKGYGFIQFTDKYDYDKCLKEMNGYVIKGKAIIIRERKKKKNDEKNNNNMNNVYRFNKINRPINNTSSNNNISSKQFINNNIYNITKNQNISEINNSIFVRNNNNSGMNPFFSQNNEINKFNSEDEEDLSSSNSSSSNIEKRKFSDNLDLIVKDDHNALNRKIQESVDKLFEHYKYIAKNSEVLKMIVYYGSNNCSFSDNIYF
jgi:RNA recognition motif-containing protein